MVLTDVIISLLFICFVGFAIATMFVGIALNRHWMLIPEMIAILIRIFQLGYNMVAGIVNDSLPDILIPIGFVLLNFYFFTIIVRCFLFLYDKRQFSRQPLDDGEICYDDEFVLEEGQPLNGVLQSQGTMVVADA